MKTFCKKTIVFLFLTLFLIAANFVTASSGDDNGHGAATILLWIALLLLVAKSAGLVEKFGQPAVLGELVAGVILGNLVLLGISFFEPVKTDKFIAFLSELGVIFLLFQVGLESNIAQMKKVGAKAFLVAIIGVVCPFILGTYIVGPLLFPGLSNNAYLFLGAALTATSVGITARVFKDLNKLGTPEAQIVLGAAVIDDVIGLVILAVVSAIATVGAISAGAVGFIFFKAAAFLTGAILLGRILAPFFGKMFSKINTGTGMKFTLAVFFALVFAYVSGTMGLAPIVGAFAAGLILDPVHFRFFKKPEVAESLIASSENLPRANKKEIEKIAHRHAEKHVEDLMEPLGHFLIPIFFIFTGMQVNLLSLFNLKILIVAAGITLVAILGKYAAGFFAGKVNKHIVGFGMVPRGEVGLIFASMGIALGVISQELFSVIVAMVIFTTLFTPPVLAYLLKRHK